MTATMRDILEASYQRRIAQPEVDLWDLTITEVDPFKRTAAEIAAGVVPTNYEWFPYTLFRYIPATEIAAILNNTSTYDATTGFQNACDAACAVEGRPAVVTLPSGKINVTFINLTNTRQVGTISRDGLQVRGAGQFATVINGTPGRNKAVIDISGSQGLQLMDMTITGVFGSVGVGVFTSSSTLLNQSHQQFFKKVYISLATDAAANGGNGTVGFWNYGSEENAHESCYYEADTAAIFSASPTLPFAYLSPINPLAAAHSCGSNVLNGVTLKGFGVASILTTVDVGDFQFAGYMLGVASGVGHLVQGAFTSSTIKAIIEDCGTALDIQGSLQQSFHHINFATPNSGACIRLRDASSIVGSDIWIYLNQLATKQLFAADVTTSSTVSSTSIKNSVFRTNLDKAYILNGDIQFTGTKMTYVLANSSDVEFHAPGYEYFVYEDRHTLRVPRTVVSLVGAATPAVLPIVKVVVPSAGVANQLGIGTVVEFNGSVTASAASPNSWGARLQAFLPFYADYQTIAITLGAGTGTVLSKVAQTPASFDVASVILTGSVASNVITVSASVARTGAVDTGVILYGTATLWQDATSTGCTSLALI
jgi:hypothetical protein